MARKIRQIVFDRLRWVRSLRGSARRAGWTEEMVDAVDWMELWQMYGHITPNSLRLTGRRD